MLLKRQNLLGECKLTGLCTDFILYSVLLLLCVVKNVNFIFLVLPRIAHTLVFGCDQV